MSGQSEPELDKLALSLANFVAKHSAVDALTSAAPLPGSSFVDRLRRNQEENAAIEAMIAAVKELESVIRGCSAFQVDAPPPEPTDGVPPAEGTNPPPAGEAAKPALDETAVAPSEPTPQVAEPTAAPAKPSASAAAPPEPVVHPTTKSAEQPTPLPTPQLVQQPVQPEPPAKAEVPSPVETAARPVETAPVFVPDRTFADDDATEELLVEDEAPESVLLDEATRDDAFDTLFKLTDERRYALATTHVAAMGERLPAALFRPHRTVLNALFATLESIDCNFAIDAKLDASLKELLGQHLPEANDLCDQLPLSAGVLGAGIISMLLDNASSDTRWTVLGFLQARFSGHVGLDALTTRIGNMDSLAIQLTRDQVASSHIGALAAVETELARMRERARNWSKDPDIHWTHRAWKTLHEEMFNPQSSIGQCLA